MKKKLFLLLTFSIVPACFGMEAPKAAASERHLQAQKKLDANLIRAIKAQDIDQVSLSLANGANIYAKDETGKNALEIAYGTNNAQIVGLVYAKVDKKKPETYLEVLPKDLRIEVDKYIAGRSDARPIDVVYGRLPRELQNLVDERINKRIVETIEESTNIDNALSRLLSYLKDNEDKQLAARRIKQKFSKSAINQSFVLASSAREYGVSAQDALKKVEILVLAGADINYIHEMGKTALDGASSLHDVEMVKFLLAKGADPKIGSPLVNAIRRFESSVGSGKVKKVIQILLQAGADPNPSFSKVYIGFAGHGIDNPVGSTATILDILKTIKGWVVRTETKEEVAEIIDLFENVQSKQTSPLSSVPAEAANA